MRWFSISTVLEKMVETRKYNRVESGIFAPKENIDER